MKHFFKKAVTAVLTAAMVLTVVVPATAEAATTISVSAPQTIYLTSKTNSYSLFSVDASNLAKGDKVTNVKSSKSSILEKQSLTYSNSQYSHSTEYFNSDTKPYKSSGKSYSASISLLAKKAGKSTVSFNIGKKSFKKDITIKAYTNPLKSLNVLDIKKGKSTDLKSLFNSSNYASGDSAVAAKGKSVKVAAASDWTITSVYFDNSTTGNSHSFYSRNGKDSLTLNVPTPSKNDYVYVSVSLRNKKDGGTLSISYSFNVK